MDFRTNNLSQFSFSHSSSTVIDNNFCFSLKKSCNNTVFGWSFWNAQGFRDKYLPLPVTGTRMISAWKPLFFERSYCMISFSLRCLFRLWNAAQGLYCFPFLCSWCLLGAEGGGAITHHPWHQGSGPLPPRALWIPHPGLRHPDHMAVWETPHDAPVLTGLCEQVCGSWPGIPTQVHHDATQRISAHQPAAVHWWRQLHREGQHSGQWNALR